MARERALTGLALLAAGVGLVLYLLGAAGVNVTPTPLPDPWRDRLERMQ